MDKKEQFIQAIQDNEGIIYKMATVYTNTTDDRDDLVQEIIYNLWKSFETFTHNASLSTWMYRVALNVAIFHLKKGKRSIPVVPIDPVVLNAPDAMPDNIEEKLKLLQAHIKDLNLLDKGIVMLYLEGKDHREIAEIIGISKTNVGTRISRIKEKLKKNILKTI